MTTALTSEESLFEKISTNFKHDIMKEVLKLQFSNSKNKMNDETVEVMCDLTKTLVVESALRAAKQASLQKKTTVTLDHMESVLPQLMLDFP